MSFDTLLPKSLTQRDQAAIYSAYYDVFRNNVSKLHAGHQEIADVVLQMIAALNAKYAGLRNAVAASINRKKTPQLAFHVAPPLWPANQGGFHFTKLLWHEKRRNAMRPAWSGFFLSPAE